MRQRHPVTPRPQIEDIFSTRTTSLYSSMAYRPQAKRSGGLPFTRDNFRVWTLALLGGRVDGITRCSYCTAILNIATLVPDHVQPLARGGSLDLHNLAPSCGNCNRRKGKISADGFRKLIAFMQENLYPDDMNDILGRLATGGEGAKMMWKRKSKAAQPAAHTPTRGLF
jgi:hypothetical protein